MALYCLGKKPPCPDPDNYIWVETKEGSFWRKKRGTVKKATLNLRYQQSNDHMKISSPAANRIVRALRPYLTGLDVGRLSARITGKLTQSLNETNSLAFTNFAGLGIQKTPPLDSLLKAPFEIL